MKTVLIATLISSSAVLPSKSAVVAYNITNPQFTEIVSTSTVIWSVNFSRTNNGNTKITIGSYGGGYQTFDEGAYIGPFSIDGYPDRLNMVKIHPFTTLYSNTAPSSGLVMDKMLVQVEDRGWGSSTSLFNINLARDHNMEVSSNNSGIRCFDQLEIQGVEGHFVFNADAYLNGWASVGDSSITIIGLQTIPEPFTILFILSTAPLLLIRSRRVT